MNKRKKITLTISITLVSIILLIGVTYALTYTQIGTNQELIVGNIWMKYEETNGLMLEDAIPTNIDNYMGHVVNPVMKNQELEEVNELTRCVYILLGCYFDNGTTPESFCRGTGTMYGRTFQEKLNNNNFGSGELNHFQNNDIISLESDGSYKINSVMQTQEIEETNEFTKCVYQFGYSFDLDEGSTPESFCKGEGTFDGGITLEEHIEYWSSDEEYFLEFGGQDLIDEGIIIKKITKERKYRLNQEMTDEELNKCVTIFRDEWEWGKQNNETWESYCNGTGTRYVQTFQYGLDNNYFSLDYLKYLEENNIINKTSHELPYFEFKISGKNTYTKEDIWYEVLLNHGDNHNTRTTRIRDDLLRFSLVEIKDGKETIVINNKKYDDITNKRIWVNTIPKNTNEDVSITYRLYMWIDESTIIGNNQEDYTLEEWEEVYASIKVNVTGDFNKKVFTYEDKYNVTDERCFTTKEAITYIHNSNITSEEVAACVAYFDGWGIRDGESFESYCRGTGTSNGKTFQEHLENNYYVSSTLMDLENNNIIKITEINASITDYDVNCGGTDVVIPETINNLKIVEIYENSFSRKELTSVVMPDTVVEIGSWAFEYNVIQNVVFSNNLETIGFCSFRRNKINNLILPDSVTTIVRDAFSYNLIKKVKLPSNLISIENHAFENNYIKELNLPDNLQYIGYRAFVDNEITNVIIPDSVIDYSCEAFDQEVEIRKSEDLVCKDECYFTGCPQ